MSDPPRLDDVMRDVLADARSAEPTTGEIRAAVARAGVFPTRRRAPRRLIGVAVATLALSGTAVAIPPVRDALANGFGALQDFLTGGGPPPGRPIAGDEPVGKLNWFNGSSRATGVVIDGSGPTRLVAYRDPVTGLACIGYGLNEEECRTDSDWVATLAASPIILRGPQGEPDAQGRRSLIGLAADAITAIELRYDDGGTIRTAVARGFVLAVEPERGPATLTGLHADGSAAVTIDVSDREWTESTP